MNDVNVQRCFKYLGVHASVKMYFLKILLVDNMLFAVVGYYDTIENGKFMKFLMS